jgi:hypothetical protein
MTIRVGTLILKFTKNENAYESFWNPGPAMYNKTFVKFEDNWLECFIKFSNREGQNYIQVDNLTSVLTSRGIEPREKLVSTEVPVSRIIMNILEYLQGVHPTIVASRKLRDTLYARRKTVLVFLGSICLSLIYYIGNKATGSAWGQYIGNSNVIQSMFLLLNIFTLGSVFFPFTIRKELSKKDIQEMIKKEIEIHDNDKGYRKEVKRRTNF